APPTASRSPRPAATPTSSALGGARSKGPGSRAGSWATSSPSSVGGAAAGASAARSSATLAGGGMPSMAEGSSSANSGDARGSARAGGSGVGTAAAGAAWILGCGAPNIIVDRVASAALAAGFEATGPFFAAAGCEGRFAVGNIMVRPAASSDVGGTGAAGDRARLPAAAGWGGGFAAGGMLFGRGGAGKIGVAFGWGSFVDAGGASLGGGSGAAARGG